MKEEDVAHLQEDAIGLGCALEMFSDYDEVKTMIDNLKNINESNLATTERAYEKFLDILSKYKEQPHLVDKYLDELLEKLIAFIRNTECSMQIKHETFKYLAALTNVRGYKTLVRHLPHEVADFEPVLQLIEGQDPSDLETWRTRYMLLLWMSIIAIIPFHMSRLDGHHENNEKTSMERLFNICQLYAVQFDSCYNAAAYLISKFLTRSDVKELYLKKFLDWSFELTLAENGKNVNKYGILTSVAMVIKHAKREDILPHAQSILSWIIRDEFKKCTGNNIQKLVLKIIQRIGLVYLPPKLAKWRYQRGSRSLASNLSSGDTLTSSQIEISDFPDEGMDIPEEIEEIIDQLLQGLRSSDNVVRWSAAKGIGRVTGRLPKDLADEVVGSVLELFSVRENDDAWHGGCLTLAELGRRGLLLPSRLPEVVPLVLKALVYDEPKGYASVGSHIRDAACYVCWSFARAYENDDLQPFVNDIAAQLLVVTCFDREINCRRAASAAFQENVGRQGTFPHGIDILTTADFFAVSLRSNAYLNISVFIAQFSEYTEIMIQHLLDRKIAHWDVAIRELTAKALHNLTPLAVPFMLKNAIPNLFGKTKSIDLYCRHGAVLGLGEIFLAVSKESGGTAAITEDQLQMARDLIQNFREKSYFRGLGGELLKQACCSYIRNCSQAHMPLHSAVAVTNDWLELINECLSYKVANVRLAAIETLPALITEYYADDKATLDSLVGNYIKELHKETLMESRMGHALALGSMPDLVLAEHVDRIVNALLECSQITPSTVNWAESRRDAIKALTVIAVNDEHYVEKHLKGIFNALFVGLQDYTSDNRGDVGEFVRYVSLLGFKEIILKLCTDGKMHLLNADLLDKVLVNVAQHAVEKIDRTRGLAATVFFNLLHCNHLKSMITHYEKIAGIFDKETCENLVWNSSSTTFRLFAQLLNFEEYLYWVLLGFICTIGGQTVTVAKQSGDAFFEYLNSLMEAKQHRKIIKLHEAILKIFKDYHRNDRVTVPLLVFLEKLFNCESMQVILQETTCEFPIETLKLVKQELFGCKNIYKVIDGVKFLCQYVQIRHEVTKKALVQLSIFLCHKHAYIRKTTSVNLFEALMVFGDSSVIPVENLDEIQDLLSNTNWEEPVDHVRPIRNKLCVLMDINVPTTVMKK